MTQQATTKDIENLLNEDYKETMAQHKITYNGRTYIIPKPFDQCFFGSEPTKEMTIHNRFSDETFQQSAKLPAFAVAIYDTIIGAERTEDWDLMQKGITWFQKNFTDAYFKLLD